jgi:hypothetical protein
VVAEVNNTPWGERHCYVLDSSINTGTTDKMEFRVDKVFHVSPFMDLDMGYHWRLTRPDDNLLVHIENYQNEVRLFDATMTMARAPINSQTLASALLRFPLLTVKITAAIYFEAMRLWLKRVPFHSHPETREVKEQ